VSVTVAALEVVPLRIPLRHAIDHHAMARRESRPLVVRVTLSDGWNGFGEALPRVYLTGETEASVEGVLTGRLRRLAFGRAVENLESCADWLSGPDWTEARARTPAAFCGLELALLDAVGRREQRSITDVLGSVRRTDVAADVAVVGFLSGAVHRLYLQALKRRPVRTVKLKVGRDDDLERVRLARDVLEPAVALTIDANGAWSAADAIARIRTLEPFGLAAVEQPVARDDIQGLAKVRAMTGLAVVADESICTESDARRLIAMRASDGWNLRVGKCGGVLTTMRLAAIAASHGIACHFGMLVGETGLLRTARRLVTGCVQEVAAVESDGGGLLRGDILREPLQPEAEGRMPVPIGRPGLGFEVDELAIRRWSAAAAVVPSLRTAVSSAS
jgi:L-alanine-DL-glutamate epimerase-like enolase superfamily enzyme